MKEKIIEYGTKHNVTVESSNKSMIVVLADEINEGFFLLGHGLNILPNRGDRGTIIFERGGAKGGYWQYYPSKPNSEQNVQVSDTTEAD